MNRKHLITLAVGMALGYVLAPQISRVPVVNKLPQF